VVKQSEAENGYGLFKIGQKNGHEKKNEKKGPLKLDPDIGEII